MTPDNALRQANMTARDYAALARYDLLKMLHVDDDATLEEVREILKDFAPVWAAMIAAASADFATACRSGVVDGTAASQRMT